MWYTRLWNPSNIRMTGDATEVRFLLWTSWQSPLTPSPPVLLPSILEVSRHSPSSECSTITGKPSWLSGLSSKEPQLQSGWSEGAILSVSRINVSFSEARKCVTLPRSFLELGISCRLCRLLWNSRSVANFHKKEYCVFWTGLECSTLRFLWYKFKVLCCPAPHFFEHWSSSI